MRPASGLRFKGNKFDGIDLGAAFDVLLRADEECLNHKQILWAGICAWFKRSSTQSSARKAIAKETARAIVLAEKQARAQFISEARWAGKRVSPSSTPRMTAALNGIASTWAAADPKFRSLYNKVYFPIGGMEQVVSAYKSPRTTHTTKSSKQRGKPKRKSGIYNLMQVATVFDYHHRALSLEKFGVPSIEKASKALSKATKPKGKKGKITGFGRGQIQELLREHRNALALLYGAHCISVGNSSLLHFLLGKHPCLAEVSEHLPDLLSYTKYFHDRVLSTARGSWAETFGPDLGCVTIRQPPLGHLDEEMIASIKETFDLSDRLKSK